MINELLQKLYSSHWDSFMNACKAIPVKDSPSNPLLIKIKDEQAYLDADIKLMFIGQETNKWYPSSIDMDELLTKYESFYKRSKKRGQFWRAVNRVIDDIEKKFPSKSIDYTWNNCLKVGRKHAIGKPSIEVRDIEQKYFNVLKDEITILKPNIILFFSGPNYDNIIREKLDDVTYGNVDPFKAKQLSRMGIPGVDYAFRTYHPGYLYRNGIDSYLSTILNEIQL